MNSTGDSLTTTEFKLLKTMSSSTDETIFSEDDSDDSDCDDEEDQEETEDVLRAEIEEEIGIVGTDAPPPPFETLVDGHGDGDRALSVSVNEEMVEVVPTDMVESVVSRSLVSTLSCGSKLLLVQIDMNIVCCNQPLH